MKCIETQILPSLGQAEVRITAHTSWALSAAQKESWPPPARPRWSTTARCEAYVFRRPQGR
ncbi:hypothetical protein HEP87_55875 [Streptomyces sp. S1D4-11]|nr:hypothetical protein [Streptomyces sp. S1D4-11]QIZ01225.1 hypothetical protein HEP87_55875 [Streptomyces sp. S1D4-11]